MARPKTRGYARPKDDKPLPNELWFKAVAAYPNGGEERGRYFRQLMIEQGYIVRVPPGEKADNTLPCGHQLGRNNGA